MPVIGITGARTDGVDNPCIAAMLRLGAVGVLRKPVDKVELVTMLNRVLDRGTEPQRS